MKRLLVAVLCTLASGAFAADQNPPRYKAPVPAPPAAATSGFYIGVIGGIGLSKTANELTQNGNTSGRLSGYPTGLQTGAVLGYAGTMGSLYYGATFEGLYDFSQGSVGCGGGTLCTGLAPAYRKNGLLLQQGAEFGLSAATIGGYIPANGQPSNWPVPITLPASVYSNLIFALRGGVAERDLTLCGAVDASGGTACATQWIWAPYAGLKFKSMLSTNMEGFVTGDFIFWNQQSSFLGNSAADTLFSSNVKVTNEFVTRAGLAYHF